MIEGLLVKFGEDVIAKACENVRKVLESGHLIYGEFIPKFEKEVETLVDSPCVRMFSSDVCAQDALYHALNLRGKKMIFQGNIFSSPVFTAQRQGIKPLWVDVDPKTSDMDLNHLERSLKFEEVHAIHVVSSGGQLPLNVEELCGLARKYGALLIEDAAHSFGSRRVYNISGGWADFTIFSFYGTKTTGFGTGGAICCKKDGDIESVEHASMLGRYGRRTYFGLGPSEEKGYSYRMNEVSAAVGCAVLENIGNVIHRRASLAKLYLKELVDTSLRLYDYGESNFYKFPVLLPFPREPFEKDMLQRGIRLTKCTGMPTYSEKAFGDEFKHVKLRGCEEFCKNHSCLPMHEWLTDQDVHYVIEAVNDLVGNL